MQMVAIYVTLLISIKIFITNIMMLVVIEDSMTIFITIVEFVVLLVRLLLSFQLAGAFEGFIRWRLVAGLLSVLRIQPRACLSI